MRVALDCFASAFALRASADSKPAVARRASEDGSLAMTLSYRDFDGALPALGLLPGPAELLRVPTQRATLA
jgi:hypothetical protein